MHALLSTAIGVLLLACVGWVFWIVLSGWIRLRWPPTIPSDLSFFRDLETSLKTREVAEALVPLFAPHNTETVVCLGPVRGTAARVLFHAGPKNRGTNVNIHRPDYVLHVVRLGKRRARLELRLNHPYTYLRLRRVELVALRSALVEAYGELECV